MTPTLSWVRTLHQSRGASNSNSTYADIDNNERVANNIIGDYAYNQLGPVATSSPGGTTQNVYYTQSPYGSGVPFGHRRFNDPHNGNFYFLSDGLGSVVGQVDSTGTVKSGFTYDAWGKQTQVISTGVGLDLGFTAGITEWDTATQTHLGARFYDTTTGRFTQPDPAGMAGMTYMYAGNSPTSFTDPTGYSSCGFSWGGLVDCASKVGGVIASHKTVIYNAAGQCLEGGLAGAEIASFVPVIGTVEGIAGGCVLNVVYQSGFGAYLDAIL